MIAAAASGSLVGFTLGLVGGGGSILATPLLLYAVGVRDPHTAIGTSALAVSASAFLNLLGHAAKGHVRWKCGLTFAGVGAAGSLAGSTLAKNMDGHALLFIFGLVMLAVAALMAKPRPIVAACETSDRATCARTAALALLTGTASGFFGIGGGFLIVPALVHATGMPLINAIGTSLVSVSAFGLVTASNYALSGLVDWTVAGEFILGGAIAGTAGMALATRLADRKRVLHQVLAAIIAIAAFYVLWRSGMEIA